MGMKNTQTKTRKPPRIPSYSETVRRVMELKSNALDEFIYHNEPAGAGDEKLFREGLQAVVDLVFNEGQHG